MLPCRNLPDQHPVGGKLKAFWRDESAATAIEYAIIAAGIGGTVAAAVYSLGDLVNQEFYSRIVEATRLAKPPAP